jgi:hypothetical protein
MPWNVSGETITIEPGPQRWPARFLRRHGLRIALVAGLLEALVIWHAGFGLLLVPLGVLAVVSYFWARRRVAPVLREPLRVVAMAQAVAGLVPLAIASLVMALALVGVVALIVGLLLLGRRRL